MVYHDIDIPLPAFIAIDFVGMTVALIPIILRFWLRWREAKPQPVSRNLSDGLIRPPPLIRPPFFTSRGSRSFSFYISLWAAKFALIAFFAGVLKLMETRVARLFVAFATFYTTSTFILHITLLTRWCDPVSRNWDINGQLCSAVHDIKSVTISTVANVSTDLVILSLPIFALTTLSRERRALTTETRVTKAEWSGFALVIAVAALSIVAALARWITLELVQNVPKANITHTIDVWALVEIVASLLAVCLPSLRSFVRRSRTESRRRMANGQSPKMLSLHWLGSESTVRTGTTGV
ncbi:hypothetical protein CIB48_g2416 [Xylaria polymorpha]|nr:hypothetical protein CIB48_g2416 [Xylaria polymorpha]